MKKILYILILLIIIGAVITSLDYSQPSEETNKVLKVGVIAPFTGKGATRGEDTLLGLRMAEKKQQNFCLDMKFNLLLKMFHWIRQS